VRDETGFRYAVKGDVDACELRPRRGFPDKTDAARNRRWVTADTPPTILLAAISDGPRKLRDSPDLSREDRSISKIF